MLFALRQYYRLSSINNKGVGVLGQLFTLFDINYLLLYIIIYSYVKIFEAKIEKLRLIYLL